MPALRITCPSCKTVLQVGESSFGKAVRCPKCQTVLKVPAAAPAPPAAAKPPTAALLPSIPPRPAAAPKAAAPKHAAPPIPVETRTSPVPKAAPRGAPFVPPQGFAETPVSPRVPPPRPADAGKGRPLLPALAIGALVVLLAGSGMVVGLFVLARMMGSGTPTPVADVDRNAPAGPSTTPTADDSNGNNPPGEVSKLAAEYLADDFTGVVVLRPKRVLASQAASGLPQEEWFGNFAALNLDPRQAEEAVLFLDPTPNQEMPVSVGGVARFTGKLDVPGLKQGLLSGAKETTFQKKKYYTTGSPFPGGPLAVCVTDDHTIAAAPEEMLKKMLSGKGAKSPLLDRLRSADHDNDVTAVVVLEPDSMRSLVSTAVQQVPLGQDTPPAVRDGIGLADQINAVTLTANLTKDPLLAVDVQAKDEKTARAVLKLVNDGHGMLQDQYEDLAKGLNPPPDVRPLFDRFSGELNKSFTATADGSHVRIAMKRPGSTKDLLTKLGSLAPPMVGANPPPPPPPPPPDTPPAPPRELKDIRKLGVDWVRDNNAFGPKAGIVRTVEMQFDEAVGFDKVGFVARYGDREMKSKKPMLLVGWNGDVFPLELTPEQGKQLGIQINELGVTGIPAGDDLGPGPERGELSDLKLDHADALDVAAPMKGTVKFHRLHPDAADEYYSLRLTVLAAKTRTTLYQPLDRNPLPKGDGTLTLDFAPLKADAGLSGPVPALVEVLAYSDIERQGPAFVVSNAAAELIVPAGKWAADETPTSPKRKRGKTSLACASGW